MLFHRGITVPAGQRDAIIASIEKSGLAQGQGRWTMGHRHPGPLDLLLAKPDLSLEDTRPDGLEDDPAVCACGEPDGAAYYAWRHNRSSTNNTPIIITFEAPVSAVAIDGRDFLYTVFQIGNPDVAREPLVRVFGPKILHYADNAWATERSEQPIALCDLAIHDPEVIEAHHANDIVLGGRHNTVFRSAFTVSLPVGPQAIRSVEAPASPPMIPQPEIFLEDLLLPFERR